MSKVLVIATFMVLISVTGCATVREKSEQLFSPAKPAFLREPEAKEKSILDAYKDAYYNAAGPEGRAVVRDRFLFEAISDIDRQYTKFYSEQYVNRTFSEFGFDLLNLGAGFAGTIMGGKFDKTVASALVTLFTGTKLSMQENLYNKQAVLAIMSKMESQRLLVGAQISSNRRGINKLVNQNEYDLSMAVGDAKRYYDAGTIMGALVALNDTAATDKNVAQDTSQKVKEGTPFDIAHDEAQRGRRGLMSADQAKNAAGRVSSTQGSYAKPDKAAVILQEYLNSGTAEEQKQKRAELETWAGFGKSTLLLESHEPEFAAWRIEAVKKFVPLRAKQLE